MKRHRIGSPREFSRDISASSETKSETKRKDHQSSDGSVCLSLPLLKLLQRSTIKMVMVPSRGTDETFVVKNKNERALEVKV